MNVCVVALGKIGLPLAVQCARSGFRVHGVDISKQVVDMVNAGTAPFPGEADLAEWLATEVASGRLTASTDTTAAVAACEVVLIVVPLVADTTGVPDFRAMDAATQSVARGLQPGTLVVYETTLPVGTTRNRFAAALSSGSGLELGRHLFVCHSPERVFSGRIFADLRRYPKLVGGVDAASARLAVAFYERAIQFDDRPDLARPNGVWDLGTAEAAELAKLAETTYRDINIAFANELARYADTIGIDVNKVIDASNSQPFSHVHRPGIAVGGHCIPVYPRFYLAGDPDARLPVAARLINEHMPVYAVERLAELIGPLNGLRVVVLGAAYRGGVKETAFSGVFPVVTALGRAGAHTVVHDPLYSDDELAAMDLVPYHLGDPCDAAILQAEHPMYLEIGAESLPGVQVVLDGRNVLGASRLARDSIRIAGIGGSPT